MPTYVKPSPISLKRHPILNERWVQDRLAEDPSLLGLGDVILRDRERPQPHAGRLDLLFQHAEEDQRYEVEVQLGATDESHIIRTIEYWDLERRRYPRYDHTAVIVAEQKTGYIGVSRNGAPNNFVVLKPKRDWLWIEPRIPRDANLESKLEEAGAVIGEYRDRWGRYRIRLDRSTFPKSREVIRDIIRQAYDQHFE